MAEDKSRESTLFLERQSYRRRRKVDAIKVLPFIGVLSFLLPVLWAGSGTTANGLIYIFVVWGALIAAMAVLAQTIRRDVGPERSRQESDDLEEP